MATGILVIGESGAGKTTSCRKLDPKTTFIIDCDKKVHACIVTGKKVTQWKAKTIGLPVKHLKLAGYSPK